MPTPRVLLVDDDAAICEFLATLLELEGLLPRIAPGAQEALGALADADAVLLDVAMPGVDGLELCRRMRAAGFGGPILVVSARPGPDLPRKAVEAGASGFVRKPFDNAELIGCLRGLLAAA
ncbi:response regulator transcription factor [Anaeromyxobacter sp. PSR-1]|uniref:response regulator transcription factor n=1 Tax=Anaeromyxobacter sp. PSR-1 TaxID=1300915 RepID=UPI0005E25951|nr:response regulator [Anaeromyxobacter sp. PSR-1]GAO05423.1 response regulator MprA [Anaeromyxobacter sp. PSR-1]